MAYGQGLTPFYEGGIADATPTGTQGRDPAQWGTPQAENAQSQPAPAAQAPVWVPGMEFSPLVEPGLPEPVPGAGPIVGIPVTGYRGPADDRWQQWQDELAGLHGTDTCDAPAQLYPRDPQDGRPLPAVRRLQVTDTTDQHDTTGAIIPAFGPWRAVERIVHNVAKWLPELGPVIPYSERPFYQDLAITAPETTQPAPVSIPGTGRLIFSPANTSALAAIAATQDPGVAVAYAQPADPQVTADTSTALPAQEDWLSYG